jgi:putative ABC transport system substrate-binding protein
MAIHIRRRELLGALGGAAAWPLVASAREPMRHIGVLHPGGESDANSQQRQAAFVDGLRKLGWNEGNCLIHDRWTSDEAEHMRLAASELVGLRPDVIFTSGGYPLLVFMRATRTIPIVFTTVYDPIGSGFVTNLSRPGGNITGFTCGEFSMGGKILEVLKQIAPEVGRVAVLLNLEQPPHIAMWRSIEATAPLLGVHATPADSPSSGESSAR